MYIDNFINDLHVYYSFNTALIILTMFLIYNSITDIQKHKIYNLSVYMLIGCRIIMNIFNLNVPSLSVTNLYGFFLGLALFFIPALLMCFRMGGDIKLTMAIGFYLGINIIPVFIGIALIYSILYGIIKRLKNGEKVMKISYITLINNIINGKLYNNNVDIDKLISQEKEENEEMKIIRKKREEVPFAPFIFLAHITLIIISSLI